jgi:hypothetical protein
MDKKAGPTDVSIRREQTTMMKARIDTDDDGINWRYLDKKKTDWTRGELMIAVTFGKKRKTQAMETPRKRH